jgi:hypothetical protein
MTAQPTAGPWEWHGDEADQLSLAVLFAPEGEHRRAYFELASGDRWVLMASSASANRLPMIVVTEADARLIAAAPRMADYIRPHADHDPEARAILQEAGVLP